MRKADTLCNLLVFGCAHAAVDATCAAVLFSIPGLYKINPEDFFHLILLYNLLAFGLQPLCGRAVDYFRLPREAAIVGCGLLAISMGGLSWSPLGSTLLAGIGNAFFHIGAGTISLNLTPNRASAPGIFVAPGALGLVVGIIAGQRGYFSPVPLTLLLLLLSIGMCLIKIPQIDYTRDGDRQIGFQFILALVLLFGSVVIRSLIGLAINYSWKSDILLLILLTTGVSIGKAVGGILADRYGWLRISGAALLISGPLVALGINVPWLGIAGMLFFNMTMAVTLVAIARLFPGRPGFAFGLPCLALFMGALMAFTEIRVAFTNQWIVFAVILISSFMLIGGLGLLRMVACVLNGQASRREHEHPGSSLRRTV